MRLRVRAAQDDVQPLHPLETAWRVQQDFRGAAAKGGKPDQLMIDATYLKAHRTAASL
jgi:hypothetical protein